MAQYSGASNSFWLSASIFILFLGLVFTVIGITYIVLLNANYFKGNIHTGTAMLIVGILLLVFSIPILVSIVRNRNRIPVHLNPAYAVRPVPKIQVNAPASVPKPASVKRSSTKRTQINKDTPPHILTDNPEEPQASQGQIRPYQSEPQETRDQQNNKRHRADLHLQHRANETRTDDLNPDVRKPRSHSPYSENDAIIITCEPPTPDVIDFYPIDRHGYPKNPSAPFIPHPNKINQEHDISSPDNKMADNMSGLYSPPDQIPAEFMSQTEELSQSNLQRSPSGKRSPSLKRKHLQEASKRI